MLELVIIYFNPPRDFYLTAAEAVAYGVIDEVMRPDQVLYRLIDWSLFFYLPLHYLSQSFLYLSRTTDPIPTFSPIHLFFVLLLPFTHSSPPLLPFSFLLLFPFLTSKDLYLFVCACIFFSACQDDEISRQWRSSSTLRSFLRIAYSSIRAWRPCHAIQRSASILQLF